MIDALLEILKPERALETEDDSLKRGLDWLLRARPSDDDPINRSQPDPKAAAVKQETSTA